MPITRKFKKTDEEQPDQNKVLTIEDKQKENDSWSKKLTTKNQDYMVRFNRQLVDKYGVSDEERIDINHRILPKVLEGQLNHTPANKLFGPPTERAKQVVENPNFDQANQEPERSEMWKRYMDGSLLLGGIFALITGISYFLGGRQAVIPLLTLLMNFLVGGLAILIITNYIPKPGEKGGFLKYIGVTTLAMLGWIVIMGLVTGLLPPGTTLNPFVSGPICLVIGGAALGARWYLKNKLNIKGTLI